MSQIYKAPSGFADQLPKNLISNLANFAIGIIIGIFLVPYFIDTLGIAAYGLIPLATSLTSYVTILTDSLNVAVSRYLTMDLHREDYKKANNTFNTALFALSGIIILLIPIVILLSYYAPIFFNVPIGQESEVILLFFGIFSAFLIRAWSSNFTVTLFAHNRLDLSNLLNIFNIIIQVSLIVLFFTVYSPQLRYIGASYFISSLVTLSGAILLSKRINPNLHVSFQEFDRSRLKELTTMGWWAVVNQIGSLLFLQIELIVVNILFGAVATGEYSIVLVWATLLRGIASTLAGLISPMILMYYAKEKISSIIFISKSAVKVLGLFIALPISLVCGFAPQILTLWVGPQFSDLTPLMWILILPLVVNLSVLPLFSINVAYNKVRIPGIVTFIMGMGNIILAFTLPLLLGWGYYGVAVAGAIMLTLKNTFFTPWYATKIMRISSNTYTRPMILGIFVALFIAGLSIIFGKVFEITTFTSLTILGGIISAFYLIFVWFFGLNQFERELFRSYIPKQLRSE